MGQRMAGRLGAVGLAFWMVACGGVDYGRGGGYARSGTHVLYLPSPFPIEAIDRVTVVSQDGQSLVFGRGEIAQAVAGRLAITLPLGITTGTVTVEAGGRTVSSTFYVAVSMTGQVTVGLGGAGPECQAITGTWVGNITDDPSARATVVLEALADCRTVHGFVRLESPRSGSVDSTLEGTWDPGSQTLIARDTQLFNVRVVPGGSFCATERYTLRLAGGWLTGENYVSESPCAGTSPVQLSRAR